MLYLLICQDYETSVGLFHVGLRQACCLNLTVHTRPRLTSSLFIWAKGLASNERNLRQSSCARQTNPPLVALQVIINVCKIIIDVLSLSRLADQRLVSCLLWLVWSYFWADAKLFIQSFTRSTKRSNDFGAIDRSWKMTFHAVGRLRKGEVFQFFSKVLHGRLNRNGQFNSRED